MSSAYQPQRARSVQETLSRSNRRVLVLGAGGTGKTTFSVSASQFAGDKIPHDSGAECADVAIFQGDNEGVAGALHAGFVPKYVYELSNITAWDAYQRELVACLKDIKPLVDEGTVKFLVVDLNHPTRLINESIAPSVQKDWKLVANEGLSLFRAFSGLRGCTIIGNAQIKAAQGFGETPEAATASNARAPGGERSLFMADLLKGVGAVWQENSSLILSRELRRTKGVKPGEVIPKFYTHTQSNSRFEAKSRFRDVLLPTEAGDATLRSLLVRAYGQAL
jgi:hypothetical protein